MESIKEEINPSKESRPLLGDRKGSSAMSGGSVTFDSERDDANSERSGDGKISLSAIHWTTSLRQHAKTHEGIGPAAFLLRDAILGIDQSDTPDTEHAATEHLYNPYSRSNHPLLNKISLFCRHILAKRILKQTLTLALWVMVILSFVEPPSWCRHDAPGLEDVDEVDDRVANKSGGSCSELLNVYGPPAFGGDDRDVQYYPNFNTAYLSVTESLMVEWVCVAMILTVIVLNIGRDGMSLFRYLGALGHRDVYLFRKGGRLLRRTRIVMLTSLILLIVGMVQSGVFGRARPFSALLRIVIFVCFSTGTKRELRTVMKFTPDLISILFLLLIVILFYGWIGVVAFYDSAEHTVQFPNLVEAMWSLWIMVTTANYPDVMMPAYNESRISVVYFISFMIVTFFFMMNIVLASVVNSYENELESRMERRRNMVQENLEKAFELLDDQRIGRINRTTIMTIFLVLNEDFPEVRDIPEEDAKLLFAVLDRDGTGLITKDEFMDFGTVLLLEFEKGSAYTTLVERFFPKTFASQGFQRFCELVQSDTFEIFIDIVLVLNAIVVGIQSYPELAGQSREENPKIADGEIDTVWEAFQTGFTVIYCVEMFVKLLVLGWKRYLESLRNVFDGFITVLSVFATAYVYYPNKFSDSRLIRYIVMARVLRLARVVVAMRPFQVIGKTFIEILPAARRVMLLLFCIMYAFSSLGMELFGGMITRDPSNRLSFRLEGTDFANDEYWANNFNDMLSGMNVLFNLLVVNNWTTQSDGIEAVTESKLSRFFFLAFHICGVIVANNLVVAFIINSFMTEWDKHHERSLLRHTSVDTGEAIITQDAKAEFDATEITGTRTEVSGKYIAKLRKNDQLAMSSRSVLKKLFTHTPSGNLVASDPGGDV